MALDMKKLLESLEGITQKDIIDWMHEVSTKGLKNSEIEEYVKDKYYITIIKDPEKKNLAIKTFKMKWNIDPLTGREIVLPDEPKESPQEPEPSEQEVEEPIQPFPEPESMETPEDPEIQEEPDDESEELADDLQTVIQEAPEAEPVEELDPIPFDNPNLEDLDIGEEERELAEDYDDPEYIRPVRPKLPVQESQSFITKQATTNEFNEMMKISKQMLDAFSSDSNILMKYAQMFDMNNHPPYVLMRPTIINNQIKDINETKVMLSVIDEQNPDRTKQEFIPLGQALERARQVAERHCWQATIENMVTLQEKMEEYVRHLFSLIYLLELYCESNQQGKPMLEMTIPKEQLIETVKSSFQGLRDIIEKQVIAVIDTMQNELKGEMGDVSSIVETNLSRIDSKIETVIERVIHKVKTDIDQTNLEDIKRALLYMDNKQRSTAQLGAGAISVSALMLLDLRNRVINENFKMDNIKEQRRYTVSEMQKRMGYRVPNMVLAAVKVLHKNKVITVYKDSTFSISK